MPRAARRSSHRLVDLGERPARGDQRFEIEAPGAPEREQARDLAQRVAAPERAADDLLLGQREQRRRRDLTTASSIGAAPTQTVVPPLRVAATPVWTRLARPTASNA